MTKKCHTRALKGMAYASDGAERAPPDTRSPDVEDRSGRSRCRADTNHPIGGP